MEVLSILVAKRNPPPDGELRLRRQRRVTLSQLPPSMVVVNLVNCSIAAQYFVDNMQAILSSSTDQHHHAQTTVQ